MQVPELCSHDPCVIWLWYTTVIVHCAAYGVFLPPCASLRATTKFQGFNCGTSIDDDLTSQFSTKLMIWDQWLANGLNHSTKSIQIHNLRGYSFIYQLIKPHYLSLMYQPSNLILQQPMQFKTESIQYFSLCNQDFFQLRGPITNNAKRSWQWVQTW